MKKVVAVVAVMIASMLFVMSASAATTYSTVFYESYDIFLFLDGLGATVQKVSSGTDQAAYRFTGAVAGREAVIGVDFETASGGNFTQGIDPGNRNRVTFRILFSGSVASLLNLENMYITFDDGLLNFQHFSPVKMTTNNDQSMFVDWDFYLPEEWTIEGGGSYSWDILNSMYLYMPFKKNVQTFTVTMYRFSIQSTGPNDDIIDEDYGYSKPSTPEQDAGLEAGNNLLDEMTDAVDEFNASVSSNTQVLIDNISKIKTLIDGAFEAIPLPITLTVSGVVVFLVIRKVVGR